MMISAEQRAGQRQVILDLLATGPASIHQIAAAIRLTKQNAHKHMHLIRAEPVRLVRIAVWYSRDPAARKYPRPYYALGSEPDAPKPCPLHKRVAKPKRKPAPVAVVTTRQTTGPFAALFI